ncbi:hypothetical protein L150_03137 [Candida albicans Ca529L]|nr:hypothetical protein L150_03137 [Candida albicans Ca529L]
MKVSTLIIVSIPIVSGLQIKDTVGTTTENTFWYQLFGTPSRSQPAAVAATAAGTEVQGFTPISTSSSSSSSAAPWYQGLFGVGRTTLGQVTTPSRTSTTTTTSNPIAPTTSIANSNNLFGTDTAPTTTTTTNARSRSRSTPVTVSGDNVLTLFGNPNLSTGNDQSNSVSKTTAETTTTSSAPSSSSSSSRVQPTVINGGGSDGVLTLFGNSEALSNFDSTTVVDSDSTARITPIASASASASSGSSNKDNDSDSSSARGIKSIPNSSEFLASLINGLGSGGGGSNGSGSNTNSYKNHSTTSTTSKYFNSSSTATKLSSSKSIYSNSTTSRSSSSVSSSSTDGGGGANLFGSLLNSVAAVSRTVAVESTLSTSTTTTSDSANSNTKDYSSYSGTITSFPSTTGSLSGDGNKLIGGNKYLISFMWTNLILTMIMLFT